MIGKYTTVTDYCGNVVYENGTPKMLLTEVGYVSLNDNKYHYFIQDHQGNNRVVGHRLSALYNLISIMVRNWIEKEDWIGMIMERGCMILCWEDGMWWIRWWRNIIR